MTLHQLKGFATVAKEGSFTKAGKVLHTTQPSISVLIIGLQRELGVKLFEWLGVKPHPTEAGRRVLQLAESALATIEKIPEEVEEVKGLKKGRLSVGGSGFAGATLLPVAVQAFKKAFPSIEVRLMIQPSVVLEEKLLNGELDLALMGIAPKSPLLIATPYREEEIVAVASPSHPLTKRRSVPLEMLAKEPMVVPEGVLVRKMVEGAFAKKGLTFTPGLEINFSFGSANTVKTAVANGLGIAFVPEHHVTSDIRLGHLKVVRVFDLQLKRTMYLALHKGRQNPLVQAFVDFLMDYKKR